MRRRGHGFRTTLWVTWTSFDMFSASTMKMTLRCAFMDRQSLTCCAIIVRYQYYCFYLFCN